MGTPLSQQEIGTNEGYHNWAEHFTGSNLISDVTVQHRPKWCLKATARFKEKERSFQQIFTIRKVSDWCKASIKVWFVMGLSVRQLPYLMKLPRLADLPSVSRRDVSTAVRSCEWQHTGLIVRCAGRAWWDVILRVDGGGHGIVLAGGEVPPPSHSHTLDCYVILFCAGPLAMTQKKQEFSSWLLPKSRFIYGILWIYDSLFLMGSEWTIRKLVKWDQQHSTLEQTVLNLAGLHNKLWHIRTKGCQNCSSDDVWHLLYNWLFLVKMTFWLIFKKQKEFTLLFPFFWGIDLQDFFRA